MFRSSLDRFDMQRKIFGVAAVGLAGLLLPGVAIAEVSDKVLGWSGLFVLGLFQIVGAWVALYYGQRRVVVAASLAVVGLVFWASWWGEVLFECNFYEAVCSEMGALYVVMELLVCLPLPLASGFALAAKLFQRPSRD